MAMVLNTLVLFEPDEEALVVLNRGDSFLFYRKIESKETPNVFNAGLAVLARHEVFLMLGSNAWDTHKIPIDGDWLV